MEANGIGREFEERAKAMGAAVPESQSLSYEIDSEGFKLVADRLVEEAGIHAMLHRLFVATIMDGDTIRGIVVESKAGREAILAQRVIDATGDADVAHRAGAPTVKTPIEHMQAASVMFHLAGVDKKAFLAGVRADPQTYRDWSSGEWEIETSGDRDRGQPSQAGSPPTPPGVRVRTGRFERLRSGEFGHSHLVVVRLVKHSARRPAAAPPTAYVARHSGRKALGRTQAP